ncbi:hypothetical protein INS49_006652 [Diaporthe citri]|uniref:uncharacterized protein n=1 Tax=Diaporthe citri TaxID=83186 RepID=UPI001C807B4C|nr:uncharacterized protein INS49_006652 [Diaporthe citri]KAG6365046.1 hypothetical protein INS49_006652 [Diaporthe citri]
MFQSCQGPRIGSHLRAPSEFEVGGVQPVDSRQLAALPDSAFVQASEGNGQRLLLTLCRLLLARPSADAMRRDAGGTGMGMPSTLHPYSRNLAKGILHVGDIQMYTYLLPHWTNTRLRTSPRPGQ